jgi:hypothetical protein
MQTTGRLKEIIPHLPTRPGWSGWTQTKDEWGVDVVVATGAGVLGIRIDCVASDTYRFCNRDRNIQQSGRLLALLPSIAAYMYGATALQVHGLKSPESAAEIIARNQVGVPIPTVSEAASAVGIIARNQVGVPIPTVSEAASEPTRFQAPKNKRAWADEVITD